MGGLQTKIVVIVLPSTVCIHDMASQWLCTLHGEFLMCVLASVVCSNESTLPSCSPGV